MIRATTYDRNVCEIGIVHLGFGAFHRAHQSVFIDDYMELTRDLRWGIAAVNLRSADAAHLKEVQKDIARHHGYFLKSYATHGAVELRKVRPHCAFADWSEDPKSAETLLALNSVHLVTLTVTESGYYTDPEGDLSLVDSVISSEVSGQERTSVYAFLRAGLTARCAKTRGRLTIACCDNIRQNGKMLERNLIAYLKACGDIDLASWVSENVVFPCSMVDRITPRSSSELSKEISEAVGIKVSSPVMCEDFLQWVLQDKAGALMPDLSQVGVTVTSNVHLYEETKIRVLNGGHTGLTYLAALEGIETFDAAMRESRLLEHFNAFENEEVLPAISLNLPFSKEDYLETVVRRFGNRAIGDTISRICADGMAKFPIFIRPTLQDCFAKGILPKRSIGSIASWHQFARHVAAGKIPFDYVEPNWSALQALLGKDAFITSRQLWANVPSTYPQFVESLRSEIIAMELKWPV